MTGREIAPGGRAIASLSDSARALAAASIAPNTRRAYSRALSRLEEWAGGRAIDDTALSPCSG